MTADEIEKLFTRGTGDYVFARWGRPLAPIAFGVENSTLGLIKGAVEALCTLTGQGMAETDPELGSNFMWFFFREWEELREVPDLDRLLPDLAPLLDQLDEVGANQYRLFRFDEDGAIKACFLFLRMDEELEALPADTLALSQATQAMLIWSEAAFRRTSPLAVVNDTTVLRPDVAQVIRAAYDPVLPAAANDASHALRLAARVKQDAPKDAQ